MNTEDSEFERIEAEAKRRAAQEDDDDTQAYTSETVAVKAYRLGYEACAKVAHRHPSKGEYMTDLRQAAQQALEALIDAANVLSAPMFADAVDALKAALEQQAELVQEPVALAQRILELEALLERQTALLEHQTARIVDLQTRIDNFDDAPW